MKQVLLSIFFSIFILVAAAQENKNTASIDSNLIKSELRIYPNPCRNEKVTLEIQEQEMVEIHFVNLTGKEVLTEKYSSPVQKTTVHVNDLPNGIYIVRLITSEKKTITQKLIVSKN